MPFYLKVNKKRIIQLKDLKKIFIKISEIANANEYC